MDIEKLGSFEREQLLRFLLHHLQPDLRGRLMAELPTVYAKMAPHTTATVLERVAAAINVEAETHLVALPVVARPRRFLHAERQVDEHDHDRSL